MQKLPLLGILGGLILIAVVFVLLFSNKKDEVSISNSSNSNLSAEKSSIPQDIKASFAIFTNGTFRVFTSVMYHNLSEDVYISAENPHIVRVKKTSITWGDFFDSLPMELDAICLTTGTGQTFCSGTSETLKFYINGKFDEEALGREIGEGDQLLVSFGDETDSEIEEQLKQIPVVE